MARLPRKTCRAEAMSPSNRRYGGTILLLLAGAIVLTLLPLPEWLRPMRPHWLTLVLFYVGVYLPLQSGILRSWVIGALADAMTGSLLGVHALSCAFTTYIALLFHQRFRLFAIVQQMLILTLIVAANLILEYLVHRTTDGTVAGWSFWGPLLTTPLCWPLLYLLGDRLLHPYQQS